MSSIKETIKAEIERLKKILEESTYYLDNSQQALGYSFALDDFKEFIDSLPDEDLYAEVGDTEEDYIKRSMAKVNECRKMICKDSLQVPESCKENQDSFTSLEEAAVRWEPKYGLQVSELIIRDIRDAFIAGAELQKGQMMKEAVEVDVADLNGEIYNNCIEKGMTDEDKVKIIIIKDND